MTTSVGLEAGVSSPTEAGQSPDRHDASLCHDVERKSVTLWPTGCVWFVYHSNCAPTLTQRRKSLTLLLPPPLMPQRRAWQTIWVDSALPVRRLARKSLAASSPDVSEEAPAFGRCRGGEMWVPLLEKAVAKALGSYGALRGGFPACALQALTGDPALTFVARGGRWYGMRLDFDIFSMHEAAAPPTTTQETQQQTQRGEQSDRRNRNDEMHGPSEPPPPPRARLVREYLDADFFDMLVQADRAGYLLAGGTYATSDLSRPERANGGSKGGGELLDGHAYAVLQVARVGEHRLLNVRNPARCIEWHGAWSADSTAWTAHPDVAATLGLDAAALAEADDFWIAFDDFKTVFKQVHVCYRGTSQTSSFALFGTVAADDGDDDGSGGGGGGGGGEAGNDGAGADGANGEASASAIATAAEPAAVARDRLPPQGEGGEPGLARPQSHRLLSGGAVGGNAIGEYARAFGVATPRQRALLSKARRMQEIRRQRKSSAALVAAGARRTAASYPDQSADAEHDESGGVGCGACLGRFLPPLRARGGEGGNSNVVRRTSLIEMSPRAESAAAAAPDQAPVHLDNPLYTGQRHTE